MSIKNSKRKTKIVIIFLIIIVAISGIVLFLYEVEKKENLKKQNNKGTSVTVNEIGTIKDEYSVREEHIQEDVEVLLNESNSSEKEILDWQLTLVNYENPITENFKVELSNIDQIRKFDSRAIDKLNQMILDMKKAGYGNIWIQSAYRTIEEQAKLFEDKVNYFLSVGRTEEDAERLTLRMINKPGTSEHNLGLAVDFNYVNKEFENTKEFSWLVENAENYGFILRYKAEKEVITKVYYEPWHWRYVGIEHAKKMNEFDMCLEEYIDYLKSI